MLFSYSLFDSFFVSLNEIIYIFIHHPSDYTFFQMRCTLSTLHISVLKVCHICIQYGISGKNPALYNHLFD